MERGGGSVDSGQLEFEYTTALDDDDWSSLFSVSGLQIAEKKKCNAAEFEFIEEIVSR